MLNTNWKIAGLGTFIYLILTPSSFALPLSAYSGNYEHLNALDGAGAPFPVVIMGVKTDYNGTCIENEVLSVENRGNELLLTRNQIQTGILDPNSSLNDGSAWGEQVLMNSCLSVKDQSTSWPTEAYFCTPGHSVCLKEGGKEDHPESILLQGNGLFYNDGLGGQTPYLFSEKVK